MQRAFAAGDTIGRYLVVDQIGAGGMGLVLRARDMTLQRDVALKRVRSELADDPSFETRLRREARAMAQISHPNVVQVYDVERFQEGLFIAMELVRGVPLHLWLRRRSRTVEEILRVYVGAGRGLSAAHDVGLVHRDFKPPNVLVGEDGRVRVTDFGLAHTGPGTTAAGTGSPPEIPGVPDPTRDSVVMGTPPYMAPEQHQGQRAVEASDQYAFCVSLWEALFGERPFRGADLARAKRRGPPAVPRDADVPPAVIRTLLRGLAPEPSARWPTMTALLSALLGSDHRRRRAGGLLAGLAVIGVAGLAYAGTAPDEQGTEVPPCEPAADALRGVWDEPTRSAFDRLSSSHPDWPAARAAARDNLDHWASDWTQTYRRVCEPLGRVSVDVAEDRQRARDCLRRGSEEVRTRVASVLEGGADLHERIRRATTRVARPTRCLEPEGEATSKSGGIAEADVLAVDHVRVLLGAGRYDEAQAELDALPDRLRDRQSVAAPIISSHECRLRLYTGDYAEAEQACVAAYERFAELGDERSAIGTGAMLIDIIGIRLRRFRDAERWVGQIESRIERLGKPSRADAVFYRALGGLRFAQRREPEAVAAAERELELLRELIGDPIAIAQGEASLGQALGRAGQYDEADRRLQRALAAFEEHLGREHPDVGSTLHDLGEVAARRGDFVGAETRLSQALTVLRAARGEDHPFVGSALAELAIVEIELRRLGPPRQRLPEAKRIAELDQGHGAPALARAVYGLGLLALADGKPEEATRHFVRATELYRATEGTDAPPTLLARAAQGRALIAAGRVARGRRELETAAAELTHETGEGRWVATQLERWMHER